MKIIVLLLTLLIGLYFACKSTSPQRELLAERQQLLAGAGAQQFPMQPLAIVPVV